MRCPTCRIRTRIRRKQQNQQLRRIQQMRRIQQIGRIRRTPRIKRKRESRRAVERVEVGSGLLSSVKLVRGYATAASYRFSLIISRSCVACCRRLETHNLTVSRSGRACKGWLGTIKLGKNNPWLCHGRKLVCIYIKKFRWFSRTSGISDAC